MRKILLIIALFFGIQVGVNAQCTPDTAIGGRYMYPEKLANAMAGYYFSQVLTFRVPSDSTIIYLGNQIHAIVDSAKVVIVLGIPTGYNFTCTPSSCTWLGGHMGCALLYGNADKNDTSIIGEYKLQIAVQTWFHALGSNYNRIDTTSYVFKILAYNGIFKVSELKPLTVYPNPSDGNFDIELRDIQSNNNVLEIYSMDGKKVYEKQFDKPSQFLTKETVHLNTDSKGIYFVRLQTGGSVLQQKVSVN